MESYIVSVDIGTSYIKLTLFSNPGDVLFYTYEQTPYVKGLEFGMCEILPEAVIEAVKSNLSKVPDTLKKGIRAITVTGQAKSELPVDEEGKPLGNSISWMDSRCCGIELPEIEQISEYLQHDPVSSTYLPFRMKWMRLNRPDLYAKAYKWVNITDYVLARLAGLKEMHTDYSEACRFMVFDSLNEKWSDELCSVLGVDQNKLPEVIPSGNILGYIAEEFRLDKDTVVVQGGHDHMCAAKAACLYRDGTPLLSTGTSEMLVVPFNSQKPVKPHGFNIDHQVDAKRWALVSCIARSGDSMAWADRTFGLFEYEKQEGFLKKYIENAEHLPYFVPPAINSNPSNGGCMFNLQTNHSSLDCSFSVLEGLTFEMLATVNKMKRINEEHYTRYRLVGGFALLEDVMKMKASAVYSEIEAYPDVDMASLGGFILAKSALETGCDSDIIAQEILSRQDKKLILPDEKIHKEISSRFGNYMEMRSTILGENEC